MWDMYGEHWFKRWKMKLERWTKLLNMMLTLIHSDFLTFYLLNFFFSITLNNWCNYCPKQTWFWFCYYRSALVYNIYSIKGGILKTHITVVYLIEHGWKRIQEISQFLFVLHRYQSEEENGCLVACSRSTWLLNLLNIWQWMVYLYGIT